MSFRPSCLGFYHGNPGDDAGDKQFVYSFFVYELNKIPVMSKLVVMGTLKVVKSNLFHIKNKQPLYPISLAEKIIKCMTGYKSGFK